LLKVHWACSWPPMGQHFALPAVCCCEQCEDPNKATANAVTVFADGEERDASAKYQMPSPVIPTEADETKPVESMVCEFVVNGELKTATFYRKPLGLTFGNRHPLTISKVGPGTEAESQGVQTGWVFAKVAGTSLAGMDLEKVMELISVRSAHLAPSLTDPETPAPERPSVTFEFVDPDGELRSAIFYRRPLGMTFANKLPLAVMKLDPAGEAERQGVQSGWLFTKVAGVPIEGMVLEKIVTLILEHSVHLPVHK